MKTYVLNIKSLLALTLLTAGCAASKSPSQNALIQEGLTETKSKFDVNMYPLNKVVCDPWQSDAPMTLIGGIKATMYSANQSYATAGEYIAKGKKLDQTLFFSKLNVPTRMFDQGFSTETGDVLKDDTGQKLIENFGIHFESVLKLGNDQVAGDYEIALLSDDGAVLSYRDGDGQYKKLINQPGITSTKMTCSTVTLRLDGTTSYPIQLDYFQGPRYHIALVALMRLKTAGVSADPLCGQAGNNLFFNPDKNSEPMQAYKDLLARKWTLIQNDNFELPLTEAYNPCIASESPKIMNFNVGDGVTSDEVVFTWTTDVASTSQILLTSVQSGENRMSASDNILRLKHSVTLKNVVAGSYSAQAIAITSQAGKAVSEAIKFTWKQASLWQMIQLNGSI